MWQIGSGYKKKEVIGDFKNVFWIVLSHQTLDYGKFIKLNQEKKMFAQILYANSFKKLLKGFGVVV